MTITRTRKFVALGLAAGLLLGACSSDADDDAESGETTTTEAASGSETEATQDIVATAAAAGDFTTLATALEAADLVETLQGPGPFTVFAPTDAAFEKLPEGALEDLLADPEALKQVLLYHVVEGEVTSEQVVGLSEATTVAGIAVPISVEGDTVKIGDATVVTADVEASNGVIHVIDTVLLPPEG